MDASIALMMPTEFSFGSSTMSYRVPQNASSGALWLLCPGDREPQADFDDELSAYQLEMKRKLDKMGLKAGDAFRIHIVP